MNLKDSLLTYLRLVRFGLSFIGTGFIVLAYFLINLDFHSLIILFLIALGLEFTTNAIDEFYDAKEDALSRPESPIVKGEISKKEAIGLGVVLYISALVVLLFLFNLMAFLIGCLIVIVSLLYSLPAFKLERFGILGTLGLSLPFSLLFLLAIFSNGSKINLTLFLWFIYIFLELFIATLCKDFKDYTADLKLNINTPPVIYGPIKLARISSFLLFLPLLYVLLLVFAGYFPIGLLLALPFLLILKIYAFVLLWSNPLKYGSKIHNLAYFDVAIAPYIFSIIIYFF